MKRVRFPKVALWLAICLMSFGVLAPGVASAAITKPYFKVFDGDVFAGGWFDSGQTSCNPGDANYQAPTYSSPTYNPATSIYKGAILANSRGTLLGASTDFGAMAMGFIETNAGSQFGFTSGTAASGNSLSLANNSTVTVTNYGGGLLSGTISQTHCIPDYYGTKQNSPTAWGTNTLSTAASGQYIKDFSPTITSILDLTSANQLVHPDKDITLFVTGNVVIDNNITYHPGYDFTNIPHFTLVVRGNIYIYPTVTNLDGLYIAQPNPSSVSTTGVIWTCHDSNNTAPTASVVYVGCGTKLIVNGALIAKQVNFLRRSGSVATATNSETSSSANIAEVINYTPEMVIGGPFFNATTTPSLQIESLVSLPPIF